MNISVELTLMPFQNEFKQPIKKFIEKLKASNFTVLENPLSTQVYGNYDGIMQLLNTEIKDALELLDSGMITLKIVKGNRSV